jgi:hypothetical protein
MLPLVNRRAPRASFQATVSGQVVSKDRLSGKPSMEQGKDLRAPNVACSHSVVDCRRNRRAEYELSPPVGSLPPNLYLSEDPLDFLQIRCASQRPLSAPSRAPAATPAPCSHKQSSSVHSQRHTEAPARPATRVVRARHVQGLDAAPAHAAPPGAGAARRRRRGLRCPQAFAHPHTPHTHAALTPPAPTGPARLEEKFAEDAAGAPASDLTAAPGRAPAAQTDSKDDKDKDDAELVLSKVFSWQEKVLSVRCRQWVVAVRRDRLDARGLPGHREILKRAHHSHSDETTLDT